MLLVRRIYFGIGVAGGTVLPGVPHDADDTHRYQPIQSPDDHVADWVLAGESLPSKGFVDDGGERSVVGITVAEVTSTLKRDADGLEGARSHDRKHSMAGTVVHVGFLRHVFEPIRAIGHDLARQGSCC